MAFGESRGRWRGRLPGNLEANTPNVQDRHGSANPHTEDREACFVRFVYRERRCKPPSASDQPNARLASGDDGCKDRRHAAAIRTCCLGIEWPDLPGKQKGTNVDPQEQADDLYTGRF
jgi:hypothetical protein